MIIPPPKRKKNGQRRNLNIYAPELFDELEAIAKKTDSTTAYVAKCLLLEGLEAYRKEQEVAR